MIVGTENEHRSVAFRCGMAHDGTCPECDGMGRQKSVTHGSRVKPHLQEENAYVRAEDVRSARVGVGVIQVTRNVHGIS